MRNDLARKKLLTESQNLPVGSKDVVPKHRVLSVVALRDAVVDVVGFGVVERDATEERNDDIVPGVIQSGDDRPDAQKEEGTGDVNLHVQHPTTQKERPEMVVFSQNVFDGMHVDGIFVGTAGCLLGVVVLVNVSVDGFDVQEPMQAGVKEIKYQEENGNW